ncbi:MAG: LamG domain-containing protein [Nitrospinota bacterium]|nr:LamG domain-containing protein [Nitrospinota bacterium]
MSQSLLLHFDGAHGATTTADSSPSAHTITLQNGAKLVSPKARFGHTSLFLDGADDYAQAAGTLADWNFGAGEAFTIDAWIWMEDTNTDHPLVALETDKDNRWLLRVERGGKLAFDIVSAGSTTTISGGSIASGQWVHLALTRDTGGAVRLFVDGSLSGSGSFTAAMPAGQPLLIGKSDYPRLGLQAGGALAMQGGGRALLHGAEYAAAYIDELRLLKNEAAWIATFTPPTEPWPLPYYVAQEHAAMFHALVIENEHASPVISWVEMEHASPFQALAIEAEHGAPLAAWVEAEHGTPIFITVDAEHASRHSLLAMIHTEHAAPFGLLAFTPVEAEHASLFAAWVEAQRASAYSLLAMIHAEHAGVFSSTIPVDAEHASLLNLLAYNPVHGEHASPFRLGVAPVIDVTDSAILRHSGKRVEILSADIRQDEGDPFWSGSITLADAADYTALNVDDSIELTLGVDTYSLIIDGKEKTRSFGQVALAITAVSPGAALSFPRAEPVTNTWPAVMARAAAEEALGQAIDWRIVDWLLPDSRLAVAAAAPLEVARQIVEAAGGLLQSAPDGSFIARPRFPISVPRWGSAAPDHVLADDTHNISARELYRYSELVNQVTIRDTSGQSTQDMTEYVADEADPLRGTLYVIPRPWRPIAVAHTGHAAVGLAPLGIQLTQKKELVEFKAGRASVGRPVYSVQDVRWQYANLGAVNAVGTELASSIEAYSLAWITYSVRCHTFAVSDTIPETIQYLVMEK